MPTGRKGLGALKDVHGVVVSFGCWAAGLTAPRTVARQWDGRHEWNRTTDLLRVKQAL